MSFMKSSGPERYHSCCEPTMFSKCVMYSLPGCPACKIMCPHVPSHPDSLQNHYPSHRNCNNRKNKFPIIGGQTKETKNKFK
eukprot:3103069-Amphidinium_carterae.1